VSHIVRLKKLELFTFGELNIKLLLEEGDTNRENGMWFEGLRLNVFVDLGTDMTIVFADMLIVFC